MKKELLLMGLIALGFISCTEKSVTIKVTNTSDLERSAEIVEVDYNAIAEKLQLKGNEILIVTDTLDAQIPSQIVFEGNTTPTKIIFPVSLTAQSANKFRVKVGKKDSIAIKSYGRLVPERKDDMCWENDRIAFRTYGPALEATGEITNGYDIWLKRVEESVIDKRYKGELQDKISYHKDNGNGMDNYKVGRTLGAGAMAPFINDTIVLANNFVKGEVLDNGPLRFTCRLSYAPFKADGFDLTETRTITLDAGSQLNKVVETYEGMADGTNVAAGIVMHENYQEVDFSTNKGYATYADPIIKPEDGQTFIATVFPTPLRLGAFDCGHFLSIVPYKAPGITYYFGAGWTKWGFEDLAKWNTYIENFATKLRSPLKADIE